MSKFRRKEILKDKLFTRLWFKNSFFMLAGSVVLALGYALFIVPHDIVPGGIYGISIVINNLTGFPVGIGALILNIPLLIMGIKILGSNFGIRTFISLILTATLIDLFIKLAGDNILVEDILVSGIFGGFLIGLGVALVIRANATTGGTDVLARIFAKYTNISVGRLMLIIDGSIILAGILVFHDITLAPYAIITIFTISRSIDTILNGLDSRRVVIVVSDQHEVIRQYILKDLDRGGTYLSGKGLYFNDKERQLILSALSRRETMYLENMIRKIDPEAFLIVLQSSEVLGRGHKALV